SESLIEDVNLVTKVYFPRVLLPLSWCCSFILDLGIAAVLLVGLMGVYGRHPDLPVLLAPVFAALGFVVAASAAVFLSALNARYRDVRYTVPVLVQVWMFLT